MKTLKNVETLKITKTYNSLEEMHNSAEYNDIWEGWQGKQTQMKVHERFSFMGAYVVETDPAKNYGRSYDLYHGYIVERDGMKYYSLHKIEVSACLHNGGVQFVLIAPNMDGGKITFDKMYIKEGYYKLNKQAANYSLGTGMYITK